MVPLLSVRFMWHLSLVQTQQKTVLDPGKEKCIFEEKFQDEENADFCDFWKDFFYGHLGFSSTPHRVFLCFEDRFASVCFQTIGFWGRDPSVSKFAHPNGSGEGHL